MVELARLTGEAQRTAKMMVRTNLSASWKMANWTRTARSTSDCMVMEGTIEIGTKIGTTTTGIGAHGAVACPAVLPVRHRACAVECSKMEEGVVDPIRTIGGVVEIGLATINVTDTTVTIDTRHRTIIAITEIGIEVIDPTRISEVDTRPPQEITLAITTACHRVVTILRVIIRTDTLPGMIVEEVLREAVVALEETLWITVVEEEKVEVVEAAAEEKGVETTTEGRLLRPARSFHVGWTYKLIPNVEQQTQRSAVHVKA